LTCERIAFHALRRDHATGGGSKIVTFVRSPAIAENNGGM